MTIEQTNTTKNSSAIRAARANSLNSEDKQKLKKAAFDFQALLINQMLQSMRENEFKDEEEVSSGYGEDTMTGLFDMQLSSSLSKNSKFGLAEMIYENLTGEKISSDVTINNKQTIETPKKNTSETTDTVSQANKNKLSNYSVNVFDVINKYDTLINSSAEAQNVDPDLIKAIIAAESNGNPKAVSKAQAKGLMQLIDGTAKSMGVKNVFNPSDNINGGTKYFGSLMEKYNGNVKMALAAYNAGPGAVDKYNGIPPYKETQNYVNKVLNYYSVMKAKQQEIASNE
jgi:soluble lytic murein transglycosylase-like protein